MVGYNIIYAILGGRNPELNRIYSASRLVFSSASITLNVVLTFTIIYKLWSMGGPSNSSQYTSVGLALVESGFLYTLGIILGMITRRTNSVRGSVVTIHDIPSNLGNITYRR